MNAETRNLLRPVFNGTSIITIMIFAFLIIVIVLVIMALKIKKQSQDSSVTHSRGHYINKGIATFMPLGYAISIPIGIAVRNVIVAVALGPAIGLVIGVIIGTSNEKRHKNDLRPLTDSELKLKKVSQCMLTGLIILGAILYIITYYVVK